MKRKLSSFFSEHNLMTQVMFVNGVVIAVLSVITFIFMFFFARNYDIMLNSQLSTIIEISADSVQTTIKDIEESSMDFIVDDDLQSWVKTFTEGESYSYEDFVASNEMKKYILDFVNSHPALKFAILLDKNYNPIVSAMGQNPAWQEEMSEVIKENMSGGERYKWIMPSEKLDNLIAVREMVDLTNPELTSEGVLVMGVDINALVKVKNSTLREYPLNALFMSNDNVLYSDFEKEEEAKLFMEQIMAEDPSKLEMRFDGKSYYRTYKELETQGWKYAIYVPKDEVFGRLGFIMQLCIVVFIAMIFLVFYLSYIITRKMVRPLQELSTQMKQVEYGIFEGVKIGDEKSNNEINALASDFNVMIKQIDTLIQENYLKKITLQETELKLLQSQINPHFLYNTLESINWMAKSGKTKEISVMVQAMSKLFRSTVNNKEFIITVKEEIDLLKNYIVIQKIRFEERLEILIDVDENFYKYKIPKFTLQPLVENSIKYALEKYSTTCIIKIYTRNTEDGVKLYVEDNGPGIEKERLELIKNHQPVEGKLGIALKNILRRMEIMYHRDDAMEIVSEYGKGTTIILTISENM